MMTKDEEWIEDLYLENIKSSKDKQHNIIEQNMRLHKKARGMVITHTQKYSTSVTTRDLVRCPRRLFKP